MGCFSREVFIHLIDSGVSDVLAVYSISDTANMYVIENNLWEHLNLKAFPSHSRNFPKCEKH